MTPPLLPLELNLLFASGWGAAQAAYQVPGFPPFAHAPKMLEITEDRGDTVLVRHLVGGTETPKNPQRIYAANTTVQIALSHSLDVVGTQYFSWWRDVPTFDARMAEVADLGQGYAPNFEAVLSVQPDLVIVWGNVAVSGNAQQNHDLLSQIAPTIVFPENPFANWEEATPDLAASLGVPGRGRAVLQQCRRATDEQDGRIHSVVGNKTVTVVDVPSSTIRLFGPIHKNDNGNDEPIASTSWVHLDCKPTPGPEVARLVGTGGGINLSLEALPELQADHLFVDFYADNPDSEAAYQAMLESPLWQRIPAAEQGSVYRLNNLLAHGYHSALHVLEQAANAVTGQSTP